MFWRLKNSGFIIVQNVRLLIPYTDNLVCTMGFTMLESTYAQYLGLVHANPLVMRTTFVLIGIFNIVGKVITGNMLDNNKKAPVIFSFVGNLLMLLSFISLATLPYWDIPEVAQQWITMATSPPLTMGFVLIYISSLSRLHHMELSHTHEVETSALLSG